MRSFRQFVLLGCVLILFSLGVMTNSVLAKPTTVVDKMGKVTYTIPKNLEGKLNVVPTTYKGVQYLNFSMNIGKHKNILLGNVRIIGKKNYLICKEAGGGCNALHAYDNLVLIYQLESDAIGGYDKQTLAEGIKIHDAVIATLKKQITWTPKKISSAYKKLLIKND